MKTQIQDVGFLIPVIDEQIYVGQRGTEPFKDFFGPIGGKAEKFNPADSPMLKETISGLLVPIAVDWIAELTGTEYAHSAAMREFVFEIFQDSDRSCISDIIRIGMVPDWFNDKEQHCHFYLAKVNRNDFNLNFREISDIKPLTQISSDKLFPTAKIALEGVRYFCTDSYYLEHKVKAFKHMDLANQIPNFEFEEFKKNFRLCSVLGAMLKVISKYKQEKSEEIE